jgi:CDP-glucose 4,6-dehydratase
MEDLVMKERRNFWCGKKVLVTGHTGFKGSWLSTWLCDMGARVTGIALEPDTTPALFNQLGLQSKLDHHICDIRNGERVRAIVGEIQPDVLFHLAAQPLVIRSYAEPVETWSTNVMGTANVLSALSQVSNLCAAVVVTTDKVYENREWEYGYRETDRLGGHDPYSASKAATEILCLSWRKSFFESNSAVRLATARAGNVIGGGDWSENRIVPDIVRAIAAEQPVNVRNPASTRPWQHVLDPLNGYLTLAEKLYESNDPKLQTAFNFGPTAEAQKPVGELVKTTLRHWPGTVEFAPQSAAHVHEAGKLALNIERSAARLGWAPTWGFELAVRATMDWYRGMTADSHQKAEHLTLSQIKDFENAISAARAG